MNFIWLALGVFFLFAEFFCPGFILIFFGLGAFVTAGATYFWEGLSLDWQICIFMVSTILSLVVLRKFLFGFRGKVEKYTTDADDNEYVGRIVVVTEQITPEDPGRIELNGSTWTATADTIVKAGEKVTIVECKNISFHVKPTL